MKILICKSIKKCADVGTQIGIVDVYICKDFKGTHVKTQIKERRKQGFSAGYMFILIPRNSRVAYINDVTRYSRGEKELLIDKNQKYQLLKKFDFFNRNGYLVRLINE